MEQARGKERRRRKGEQREERKGFIVDPASNAYSHVAGMPIVCLTPSMDFLERIQLKPTFVIASPRYLSTSASLITLRSLFSAVTEVSSFSPSVVN